jgi:glycosyltransferase involved in cell wall biosynthesis
MSEISFYLPTYNEIRFIRRTLESIISEADEILVSDYGSTDGTLEVIKEFSSKHPQIIYTIHKDLSAIDRFNWFCQNARGKYIRLIGAHDMVSEGSSKTMADLLEKHEDAVMVFHQYTINLNPDYSFKSFHYHNEFNNDLIFDSQFFRVKSMIKNICDFSIYYGLYRIDLFKYIMSKKNIFQYGISDHTLLAECARAGKILIDDKSIFFRMHPHDKNETTFEQGERINRNLYPNQHFHPLSWTFTFICEQYYLATEMQSQPAAPANFAGEILNILLEKYWDWAFYIIPNLNELFPLVPEREIFCTNLLKSISDYQTDCQKRHQDKIKISKSKQIIIIVKKIIKNLLPYFIVSLYKRNHN